MDESDTLHIFFDFLYVSYYTVYRKKGVSEKMESENKKEKTKTGYAAWNNLE